VCGLLSWLLSPSRPFARKKSGSINEKSMEPLFILTGFLESTSEIPLFGIRFQSTRNPNDLSWLLSPSAQLESKKAAALMNKSMWPLFIFVRFSGKLYRIPSIWATFLAAQESERYPELIPSLIFLLPPLHYFQPGGLVQE
jgi:hypothetical protein